MKSLIKVLSLLCLLTMILSLSASAFAETAKLRSTQDFLDFLDSKGVKYTLGSLEDGREDVTVSYTLDNFSSLKCRIFFKDDCEEVSLRIWNIITATAGKNRIYNTINTINKDYKFAKFVFDESDSTVQAELDVYIDGDHCGRSVYDSMRALFNVTDRDDVAEMLHDLE